MAPDGVDAALDLAGAGVIPDLIAIVGDGARVLSIADINAPKYGAQVTTSQVAHPQIPLAEVARIYEEGAFDVHIDGRFPLDRTAEAQTISQAGHVAGKLVITMP